MPSAYTNTEVTWRARQPQNAFGDVEYNNARTVKARKEDHQELVNTAEGKEILSKHIFYISPPEGSSIAIGDKLDDEIIEIKYVMRTRMGTAKMYKFVTV